MEHVRVHSSIMHFTFKKQWAEIKQQKVQCFPALRTNPLVRTAREDKRKYMHTLPTWKVLCQELLNQSIAKALAPSQIHHRRCC